jgi:chemotaxis protein MotB
MFPAFACLAILAALNSGCAVTKLKEANQRLKESNDRLISENNRLESELASLQRNLERQTRTGPEPVLAEPAAPAAPLVSSNIPEDILPGLVGSGVSVRSEPGGIRLTANDKVFFALGQAKLSSSGQQVLRRIGRIIKTQYPGSMIRVEGHTDDVPIRKVRHIYPSNWELSTARACTVVRFLVEEAGVSPQQIYPAGFAYFKPVASGTSADARSQNRRVEITIVKDGLPGA